MSRVKGFVVYQATDPTEGRTPPRVYQYCLTRADAEMAAVGQGVQGEDGEIEVVEGFVATIGERLYFIPDESKYRVG